MNLLKKLDPKLLIFVPMFICSGLSYYNNLDIKITYFFILSFTYIYLLLSDDIPILLSSIMLPLAYCALNVGSPDKIFSVWSYSLLYILAGGIVISGVIQNSGISQNIINFFCKFSNYSFYKLMYLLAAIGIVLTFLIPSSTCRCLIFLVLCACIAEQFSIKPLSREGSCLFICGYFACTASRWMIITGDLGGIAAMNAYFLKWGTNISYLEFLYHNILPALVYTFMTITLTLFILRPKINIGEIELPKVDKDVTYRNSMYLIIAILLLVVTNFLHNINLAIIFVGGACIACIPTLKIMNKEEFNKLSFSPIFVLAGILTIGVAASTCGLIDIIVKYISTFNEQYFYIKIFAITSVCVNLLCHLPTIASICPIFNEIAQTPEQSLNFTYLILYGADQIIIPSAWAICLYFYMSNYVKLSHLLTVLCSKTIIAIPLIMLFQWYWNILI